MEISLVVVKVLGIYLVISGLFIVFRGKTLARLLKDLFDHPAVLYITGAMLVFLSSVFLVQYNIWDGTWRTIITIFMWATLLKGIVYILAPEMLRVFVSRKMLGMIPLYGIVVVAMGIFLFYIQ